MKKSLLITIGVVSALVVGFGGWYLYSSGILGGAADDTPPALELSGGAGFQGKSVDTTYGFQQYDADDVAAFDDSGMSLKTSPKSINFFNIKSPTDFAEIEASVKPTEDLKLLIVHFDKTEAWPGDPADKTYDGCFLTYPVGPYVNTCEVLPNDLANVELNPGETVILIANINFEYDSNLLAESKTLGSSLNIPEGRGWSLHAISPNMEIPSNVTNVWVQKAQNDFEKAEDPDNIDITREYKMAWFKMTDEPVVDDTTPPSQEVAECGDGNVDEGEECDDGNNVAGDGCEADCTETPAPVCGDGNVDEGEECDDGNTVDDEVCLADCTLPGTDALAAPICGDGIVDEGETCDDGNNISGDGCSATCVIERTAKPAPDSVKDSLLDQNRLDTFTKEPVITQVEETEPTFQLAPIAVSFVPLTSISYLDNLATATINGKPLSANFVRYGDLYTSRGHNDLIQQAVAAIKVIPQGSESHYIFGDINFKTEGHFELDDGTDTPETDNFCAGTGAWRAWVLYEASDGTIKEANTMEDVNKDGKFTYAGSTENKEAVFMYPGQEYILVITMNDINCDFSADREPYSHTMITSFNLHSTTDQKVTYSENNYSNDIEDKYIHWILGALPTGGGTAVTGHSFF